MSHPAEQKVLQQLARLGVAYEILECDPELADTAQFCAHYGFALAHSANTIIVTAKRGGDGVCACLNTADTRLDVNRRVRDLLGCKKASFASADETIALTGMLIGGVSIFGLPDHLPKYIDERVMAQPYVVIGGGSRSIKVKLPPAALTALPGVQVVADLATPVPATPA